MNTILIESGTNELEIAKFKVGSGNYAINVTKILSIVKQTKTTKIPNMHTYVKGIINFRGAILPVIDLSKVLEKDFSLEEQSRHFIITYFNNKGFAFEIDMVTGTHRLGWQDVKTPDESYANTSFVTGVIEHENTIVLALDFEKIISTINPQSGLKNLGKISDSIMKKLKGKNIVVVEDSSFLINIIESSLKDTGAEVTKFSNGKTALEFIESTDRGDIFCIVSDIEMPQMDGLTLTKKIKEKYKIPVILFSSLISDDLRHRGESVGADAQISKPEIGQLIETIFKATQ